MSTLRRSRQEHPIALCLFRSPRLGTVALRYASETSTPKPKAQSQPTWINTVSRLGFLTPSLTSKPSSSRYSF